MPVRRSLHFARHALLRGTAVLLLLAAALVGLLRLAMPWLAAQPEVLAQVLGEALRAEVSLEQAQSSWGGSGPRLSLHGLALGERDSAERLQLQQSELQVDLFGFLPGRHWVREVVIDGVSLTVERRNGQWGLSGLPKPGGGDSGALQRWLDRIGAVRLREVIVEVVDRERELHLRAPAGDLLFSRQGATLQVGLRLGPTRQSQGSLQLVAHSSADLSRGRAWLGLEELALAAWAERIQAPLPLPRHGWLNGGVWLQWDEQGLAQADVDLTLREVGLGASDSIELPGVGAVDAVSGLPDGRLLLACWRDASMQPCTADWEDPHGRQSLLDGRWSLDNGALGLEVSGLRLSTLAGVAPLLRLPDATRAALYQANPRGVVERLSLVRPAIGDWWMEATLAQVEVSADPRRWPGVRDLQLHLLADPQGVWGEFTGLPPTVSWPGAWPEPVTLDALDGQFALASDEAGREFWFQVPRISYAGANAAGRGSVRLEPGRRPQLQMEARANGELAPSRWFWVRTKMSPKSVAWLEQALDNGHLDDAQLFYRGNPRDWPFRRAQGRLELIARGSDLALDYHRQWPQAQVDSAQARIVNRSLIIDSVRGSASGVAAQASGSIDNFREPILRLSMSGAGEAADMLKLLRSSPLEDRHGSVLLGMDVSGPVETELDLVVPLRDSLGEPLLDGRVTVSGLNFSDAKWDTRLSDVHGQARYSLDGFTAQDLAARFGQSEPVALQLALGKTHTGDEQLAFVARLDGQIAAAELFADHAEQIAPILDQTSGHSHWQGALEIPADGTPPMLRLRTDLRGTRIGFPAPLDKAADLAAPLELVVELGEIPQLQLSIAGRPQVQLQASLPHREQVFRGRLQLGQPVDPVAANCVAADAACQPSGLSIAGSVERVELGAWLAWLAMQSMGEGPGLALAGIDLQLTEIDLLGQRSPAKRLRYVDLGKGGWEVELDSDPVAGSVRLDPRDGKPALAAEFARLHLPDAGEAAGQGGTLDPRQLPALHFSTEELKVGPALLGQTRIEAYPTIDGLRFEQLEARSEGLTLTGSGLWGVDPAGRIGSSFQLRFSAEDLGRMLSGLGFAAPVQGGQTLASIDARWDGPPTAFGLERLAGTMEISVGPGQLLDLDPGAGRVFGLFALRALPRRLTLDFRDVFGTGLAFDQISGSFQFQEGNAWTTDLNVRGPAADITVVGRTGLALRDYDQEIAVLPRVGSAFPVVGALAGGPAGAAAGWLVQGVLGGGLDGANRYLYSVTGTWEEPAVERMDRPLVRREGEG